LHWSATRNDCGGVLSPDVDGLRQLYHVKDKSGIVWQKTESDAPTDVHIGRFVFDADAFSLAAAWLNQDLLDSKIKYIMLDEVGPLELAGLGWDSWLREGLQRLDDKTLIMVVRESLVDKVIENYGLVDYEVVGRNYFSTT
jgi:nucleoside-triphosphatase THEP1